MKNFTRCNKCYSLTFSFTHYGNEQDLIDDVITPIKQELALFNDNQVSIDYEITSDSLAEQADVDCSFVSGSITIKNFKYQEEIQLFLDKVMNGEFEPAPDIYFSFDEILDNGEEENIFSDFEIHKDKVPDFLIIKDVVEYVK